MPTLEIFLFGGFQTQRAGAPVTGFESVRVRALLAYLVVHADRAHAREALAALLWPERSDKAARGNLRQALNNLQRVLQNPSAQPPYLLVERETIQFNRASDVWVDVWEFERIAAPDEPRAKFFAARHLQAALRYYRGELLTHFFVDESPEFEEWLLLMREKYHQAAVKWASQLLTTQLALGAVGAAEALQTAQRLLELEPWHEAAHRAVMQGYARAGNRSAAVAQYETLRRALLDDVGVEPSAETNALFEKIRAGEPLTPSHTPLRHNLPADLTPFIGRAQELAEVDALLAQPATRLVTLTGLGGAGKTRLAIRSALTRVEKYRDGVFWVALGALETLAEMIAAFAQTFALDSTGEPDLGQAVVNFLRDKELLLLLDNFEQLREGAGFLATLRAQAPRVQLLVTSREPLDVEGEQLYPVGGLDYPAHDADADAAERSAVRLFVASARRVDPRFVLDAQNAAAVYDICCQVMGLPLALELAAAWVNVLSAREIAAEIRDSLRLLETIAPPTHQHAQRTSSRERADAPQLPTRQRSVRAVLAWTTGLLNVEERAALQALTAFHGGFTREAAERIARVDLRMLRALTRLALLHARGGAGAPRRYDMHPLVRQFADVDLDAPAQDRDAIAARHSVYFLQYVAARADALRGETPQHASAELRAELDNVRAAWDYAVTHAHAQTLAGSVDGLSEFYSLNGLAQEGAQVFRAALTRVRDERVQGPLMAALANLITWQGKHQEAAEFARVAVEIGERIKDRALMGAGYLYGGQAQRLLFNYAQAADLLERALKVTEGADASAVQHTSSRERDDAPARTLRQIQADAWLMLGMVRSRQGQNPAAQQHCAAALELYRALGDRRGQARALNYLGLLALDATDYAAAERALGEGLNIFRAIGDARGEGIVLSNQLLIALDNGDYPRALQDAQGALELFQRIGERTWQAITHTNFARIYDRLGAYERALERFERVFEINRSFEPPRDQVDALSFYALVMAHTAPPSEACRATEGAVTGARAAGDLYALSRVMIVYGSCLTDLQFWDRARAAYQESSALMAQMELSEEDFEAATGLARIALACGNLEEAFRQIEPALAFTETRVIAYAEEPLRPYLTIYRVLQACGDARADAALERAYRLLQERAARLDDETLRRSYLENVAWNREVAQAWRAAHGLDELNRVAPGNEE